MKKLSSSQKELIVIFFFAVIIFLISNTFNVFSYVVNFVQQHESWQFDDLIVISIVLVFALGIFSYRRWTEMEREIGEREKAESALLLANKKLNLLNSITRHDILNGLTGLFGHLELTEMKTQDPAILSDIHREKEIAELIQRQIAFTKDYQDIGLHRPDWQDAGECITRAQFGHSPGTITIINEITGLEIFADLLLEKVFYNLIDNALRYGGPGMTTIRFSSIPSGDSMVIVAEDDGQGITEEDKKHLFTRGFGKHTGFGLFLIREILSITGLFVRETSKPGMGARFEITVPKGLYRFKKSGT
jgi:signal transduction histidine kinase